MPPQTLEQPARRVPAGEAVHGKGPLSHEAAQELIRSFIFDELLFGDGPPLDDQESLLERGLIDSTGLIELVSFLEATFAISIENAELTRANLDTVARMAELVTRKLATAAA